MITIKGSIEGYAKMIAGKDKTPKQWAHYRIDADWNKMDRSRRDYTFLIDSSRAIPSDDIKYIADGGFWVGIFWHIIERLQKYYPDEKAVVSRANYFDIFVEDQDYDLLERRIADILNELKQFNIETFIHKDSGGWSTYIKTAKAPSVRPLDPELEHDMFGNKFEIGDLIVRSKVDETKVFTDVIIGTTEKSLICLTGGNCKPENTIVIQKHNGQAINVHF